MNYEIKNYDPKFIEKQVDLIWKVSDNWKYPIATSYESIKKTYSSEKFDPTTRFYAMNGNEMVGYITSAIAENKEEGKFGTMRLPVVQDDNEEISDSLMEKTISRFRELGINVIRTRAGKGVGNTLKLAEKYGFEKKSLVIKQSMVTLDKLKISNDISGVVNYDESYHDTIKDLFLTKMYPGGFGEFMHDWALNNKNRKLNNDPHQVSWKLIEDDHGIVGFSYLHRSDHNPKIGNLAPVYIREDSNPVEVVDKILSAHISDLKDHGLIKITTYLNGDLLKFEEVYNKLGFKFDELYSYQKNI